jgi:hypothetical protein
MKALTKSSLRYLPPRVAGTKTFILVNEQDVEAQEARMAEAARIKKENLEKAQAELEKFKVQPKQQALAIDSTPVESYGERILKEILKQGKQISELKELLANHIDAPHKVSEV